MALSDVILQNYMPRNILESDDEADSWSNGRSSCSSSESGGSSVNMKDFREPTGFSLFQDYFGLSNLLSNVKISDDNPLLYTTQKNLALLQRARRLSWGSDGSDNAAVLSPTMESQSQYNYDRNIDSNNNTIDPGMKPLPPPSMRLSKAMRDHIISGAYQQQVENRNTDKFSGKQPQKPLIMPPSPPAQLNPPPPPPPVLNLPPPPPPPQAQAASRNPQQQQQQPGVQVCVFCRNNGESESVYTSHVLKDADGRTSCPILRAYTCPICKANGDNSHTIKYCPMNQNARMSGMMNQQHNHPPMGGFVPRQQMPPRPNGFRPPFPPNLSGNHQQPRFNHNQNHNNNGGKNMR